MMNKFYKLFTIVATPFVFVWVIIATLIIILGYTILWVGTHMLNDKPSNYKSWGDIKRLWFRTY